MRSMHLREECPPVSSARFRRRRSQAWIQQAPVLRRHVLHQSRWTTTVGGRPLVGCIIGAEDAGREASGRHDLAVHRSGADVPLWHPGPRPPLPLDRRSGPWLGIGGSFSALEPSLLVAMVVHAMYDAGRHCFRSDNHLVLAWLIAHAFGDRPGPACEASSRPCPQINVYTHCGLAASTRIVGLPLTDEYKGRFAIGSRQPQRCSFAKMPPLDQIASVHLWSRSVTISWKKP